MASHAVTDVASAGTTPAAEIHPLAIAQLAAHGLAPLSPIPTSAGEVLRPHDIVVAVCDNAFEGLGRDRVDLHWSIPDPATGSPDDFRNAFDDLTPRIGRLAEALTHG
jgi:protein-tyrosine-phosphatase